MLYNKFQDKQLSALGMGCMRLPVVCGDNAQIDMQATKEMIAYAMGKGINYYDTAWGYHSGMSEPVMGEVLSDYPRESFYVATKFPGYDANLIGKVEEIFEKQLQRLRVDYFDFYLFHNLCEANVDGYLDPKLGIYDYLMEQKRNGRIRHLGFSAHASLHTMKRFLDAYGKDMEFCQLQINWLDWDLQNAKAKVELVQSYGIPIWVMEPVRGGSLASLDLEYEYKLRAFRPEASMAEWAFRFLQSLGCVTMTLSGMSNFDQLKENIETYSENKPLSEPEMQTLMEIAQDKISQTQLPCTSCKYCTDHCPQNLNIPEIISLYNEYLKSNGSSVSLATEALDLGNHPSSCIGCRSCEQVCPQGIQISEMMSDFANKLS